MSEHVEITLTEFDEDGHERERRSWSGTVDPDRTPEPAPVDWPARFRAAAEVADERYEASLHYALHVVGARLHESADAHPGLVEAIGRALLGETQ